MSIVVRLLTFDEAADTLDVPRDSLRTAADRHAKTINIGRDVRLHTSDLEELIDLCRVEAKGQDFTGESPQDEMPFGKSGIPEISGFRPARTAASKLESRSPNTLGKKHRPSGPASPQELTVAQVLTIHAEEHGHN